MRNDESQPDTQKKHSPKFAAHLLGNKIRLLVAEFERLYPDLEVIAINLEQKEPPAASDIRLDIRLRTE